MLGIKYNAPVILTFSLICSIVFFISQATGGQLMNYFIAGDTINLTNPIALFTMFSHVIGHGSIEHLLGNLTFVLLLGPIIEEKYGSRNTLIMILITAMITSILNAIFFNTGLLGASGIVFMLILLVSFTNVKGGQIPLTFILVTLLFIGKEIIQSLNSDHISQFAHIIGGICGSFFGFAGIMKKKDVVLKE
jgi:membrane associated rhomboid family serine protease